MRWQGGFKFEVQRFGGIFPDQTRVLGEASKLQSLPYKDGLTQLHLMIQVGGLTTYAAGNRAVLVRFEEGEKKSYAARLDDLIKDADLSANVDMHPADVLIIPEFWF